MSETTYAGIDYAGNTTVNRDVATGIRYGVIPQHAVLQAWADDSEADYGPPTCPKCGDPAVEFDEAQHDQYDQDGHGYADYACETCRWQIDSGDAFGEDPRSFYYEQDGLHATQSGDDTDIFVLASPYYTHAQFCSPCAPGACYLLSPLATPATDNRAYCFGHDWFEEGIAPYPVYRVSDGARIVAARQTVPCDRCAGTGRVATADLAAIRGVSLADIERDLAVTTPVTDHAIQCWVCAGNKTVTKVVTESQPTTIKET